MSRDPGVNWSKLEHMYTTIASSHPPPLTPATQRLRQQLSLPDPDTSDLMTSEDTEAFEATMEADLQHSASTVTVLEKHDPSDRIGM